MSEITPPDEFYVGYQAKAPDGIGRTIRRAAGTLLASAAVIAAVLTSSQGPFDRSRFAFQDFRPYRGQFFSWPHPMLATEERDYLLVGFGKHGAGVLADDGAFVELRGAKAENGADSLLEVEEGSVRVVAGAPPARGIRRMGPVTLSGEIVDTKCHFGVMNPGRGKVHRDCAARCISGGVPPGLLARDADGRARVFVLTLRGDRSARELRDFAGEPVTISGEVIRSGSTWILETSLDRISRE